ncbi:hypothetical protein NBRC116188_22380 [Oceaniserpentilla sp. 4NH20-0058]|uniref:hypothetical protein n=1 Tax=Oceaniserpentilla sp. 4NH20-0058 TaxID=3127660 RepID=UPI00310396DE
MIKINKKLLAICLCSFALQLWALEKSTLSNGFDDEESPIPFDTIYNHFEYTPYYLVEKSQDIYYGLSGGGQGIGYYDLKNKTEPIGWPLTSSSPCNASNDDCVEPWWVGRWSEQEFLEPEIKKRLNDYEITLPYELSYGDEVADAIGCLEHTPLRYGDIDADSDSELVLFLKNTLVVFSPTQEKVVFSTLFNYPDYITWQTLIDAEMYLDDPDANTPQYASLYEFKKDRNAIIGYRGYSKLYVQDFDNNQNVDLVLWRKLYQSRLQGDSLKGFEKLSDSYLHYKKVDGAYQLQTGTAPETVQGWLTANNLSWQKGFPSKSECDGQEGQLIPEMHDALLNDPDVLK